MESSARILTIVRELWIEHLVSQHGMYYSQAREEWNKIYKKIYNELNT